MTAADNVLGVTSQSRRAGTERYQYTPYGQRTTYTHGWIMQDVYPDGEVNAYGENFFEYELDTSSDSIGDGDVDATDYSLYSNYSGPMGYEIHSDPSVMHPKYRSFRNADGLTNAQTTALCEFGHQGLIHDEEFVVAGQAGSNLIYNRARTLHSGLGWFMQRDPTGYPDGLNAYAAYHILHGRLDPEGLWSRLWAEEGWIVLEIGKDKYDWSSLAAGGYEGIDYMGWSFKVKWMCSDSGTFRFQGPYDVKSTADEPPWVTLIVSDYDVVTAERLSDKDKPFICSNGCMGIIWKKTIRVKWIKKRSIGAGIWKLSVTIPLSDIIRRKKDVVIQGTCCGNA